MPRKFPEEFTRFDLIVSAMEMLGQMADDLQHYDKDDPRVKQGLELGELLLTELRGPKLLIPEPPDPAISGNTVLFPRKGV